MNNSNVVNNSGKYYVTKEGSNVGIKSKNLVHTNSLGENNKNTLDNLHEDNKKKQYLNDHYNERGVFIDKYYKKYLSSKEEESRDFTLKTHQKIQSSILKCLSNLKTTGDSPNDFKELANQIHMNLLEKEEEYVDDKIKLLKQEIADYRGDISYYTSAIKNLESQLSDAKDVCLNAYQDIQNIQSEISDLDQSMQASVEKLNNHINSGNTDGSLMKDEYKAFHLNKTELANRTVDLGLKIGEYEKFLSVDTDLNTQLVEMKNNSIKFIALLLDLKMMESIKKQFSELQFNGKFSEEKVIEKYPNLNASVFFEALLYDFDLEGNKDVPIIKKIKPELQNLRLYAFSQTQSFDINEIKKHILKYPGVYSNLNTLVSGESDCIIFPNNNGNTEYKSCFDYAPVSSRFYPSIRSYCMAYTYSKDEILSNILDEDQRNLFDMLNGAENIFVQYESGEELNTELVENDPDNCGKLYFDNDRINQIKLNDSTHEYNFKEPENYSHNIKIMLKQIGFQINQYRSCFIDNKNLSDLVDSLNKTRNLSDEYDFCEAKKGFEHLSSLLKPLDNIFVELYKELYKELNAKESDLKIILSTMLGFARESDLNFQFPFLILLLRVLHNKGESILDASNAVKLRDIKSLDLFEDYEQDDEQDDVGNNDYLTDYIDDTLESKHSVKFLFENSSDHYLALCLSSYFLNSIKKSE